MSSIRSDGDPARLHGDSATPGASSAPSSTDAKTRNAAIGILQNKGFSRDDAETMVESTARLAERAISHDPATKGRGIEDLKNLLLELSGEHQEEILGILEKLIPAESMAKLKEALPASSLADSSAVSNTGLRAAIMHAHNELKKSYSFLLAQQRPLSAGEKIQLETFYKAAINILTAMGRGLLICINAVVTSPLAFCDALSSACAYLRTLADPKKRNEAILKLQQSLDRFPSTIVGQIVQLPQQIWDDATAVIRGVVQRA